MTTAPRTQPRESYAVGDLVIPDPDCFRSGVGAGVHRIVSVPRTKREKNYKTAPVVLGTGVGVKSPASALLPFDGDLDDAREVTGIEAEAYLPTPPAGTLMRVTGHDTYADGTLLVSLGYGTRLNTTKATTFGGTEGDRYHTGVPNRCLSVIPLAAVLVDEDAAQPLTAPAPRGPVEQSPADAATLAAVKVGDHGVWFHRDGREIIGRATAVTDFHVTIGSGTDATPLAELVRFEACAPINAS